MALDGGTAQASGVAAGTMRDGTSYSPTGGPGRRHWQQSTITDPGLDDRGGVFFAALQMTRMPMILTDPRLPDNPIVFANKAFLDLTGYEEDEVEGRNCRFLQGTNTDRESVDELRRAIEMERAVSLELLNYRRDGTPFWNAVFVAPVYDTDGQLIYFFASQLDVTRRHSSEQAYRQAQKMEAIGQLTAGLAHDFNNLLQVIAGNVELVLKGDIDDRQRRQLENAGRAAERGARLTRQLLAFARKTRLEPRRTDLNTLINDFGEMLDNTVGARIDLILSLKRRLPQVQLDPVHFEMALLNVLINARDAMPRGGTVTVSTSTLHLNGDAAARHLPPGDYVILTVEDQGQGMPVHVLERATEPFFTTKGAEKGTGLGLAMVHGFVEQSLGRLEIASDEGKGTVVRMLFPVARAHEGSPPVTEAAPLRDADDQPGHAETILVVEDSEDVRTLAENHLTSLGYRVQTAESGEQALQLLEDGAAIDLLFTDIVMPGGMSGLELAEQVGRLRPDVPILITTGYNDDLVADIPRGTSLDVIGKPYRRSELADRVRAALNRRHQGARREPSGFGVAEA
ncbi:histidine kinase famiy protein [Geminicoccus roseus]|uniref:histidine kinase famiy protein n=1 Tax=Geminicoccus roseus TaxID=404900 RepID=UPI0004835B64